MRARAGSNTRILGVTRIAVTIPVLLAGLLLNSGCQTIQDADVHLYYQQVANFYDYKLCPTCTSAGGGSDRIFVLFRLTSINNNDSNAVSFDFDIQNLVTVTNQANTSDQPLVPTQATLLKHDNLATITVPAGQTKAFNNSTPRCFIKHAKFNTLPSLGGAGPEVNLLHKKISGNPPVIVHRVPKSSLGAASPADPDYLFNKCNGS